MKFLNKAKGKVLRNKNQSDTNTHIQFISKEAKFKTGFDSDNVYE